MIILGVPILSIRGRHANLQRVEKAESDGRPEILDANEIEQNKPAVHLPHTAAQFTDEMRFAVAGRADDHTAQRLVHRLRVARSFVEIIHDVVERALMQRGYMVGWVAPDAFELTCPVKIHRAEGFELDGHRSIHRMWRGSPPK